MRKHNSVDAYYKGAVSPCADFYETHKFSTVSCLDLIYHISSKPENTCEKYRYISFLPLNKP
jgi:hypothetical protein